MVPRKRIGILGGTFDPIHKGHTDLARTARKVLNLDRVYFVPVYQAPLKSEPQTQLRHRLNLVRAAIRPLPFARVSLFETKRKGPSFTINTLRYFRKRFGQRTEIFFLSGNDVLRKFQRWKLKDLVLKECRFVVAPRPGSRERIPKGFVRLKMHPVSVSSTQIRRAVRLGRSTAAMLAPAVRDYIGRHGLYDDRS